MNYPNIYEFTKALGVKSDGSITIEKLLERAYQIRNFEIELYWKRASYFWGFLIAAFTAFFVVSDTSKFGNKPHYELLVICIGFIFSLSWYLVNRGSLYWQANWERMIEAIEERLNISFYRSNMVSNKKVIELVSWHPFSLSRINTLVSFFVCVIWICILIWHFTDPISKIDFQKEIDLRQCLILIVTIIFTFLLFYKGQSPRNLTRSYSFEERIMRYKTD